MRFRGIALGVVAVAGLAAYGAATWDRLGLAQRSPLWLVPAVTVFVLMAVRPFAGALVVLLAVPCFGNHPGGRGMDLLNLLLAANLLGLCFRALAARRPPPAGLLWRAAALSVASAGISLVAAAPGIAGRLQEINSLPIALVEALTAFETDPLYSISSATQLVLAVSWSFALCWAGADRAFAVRALRAVAVALSAVTLLGALDFHHVIDMRWGLLYRIDSEIDILDRFQSVFWNPGWFAWYFSLAFGLSLGLLWIETGAKRALLGCALGVGYLYFLANSQRGGFLAVHGVLLVLAVVLVLERGRAPHGPKTALALTIGGPLLAVIFMAFVSDRWLGGLSRLVQPLDDFRRERAWRAAIEMWRSSPFVGIGEGAFAWRFLDLAPKGPARDVGPWGDAHNLWLQVLATRGLFGLACLVAVVAALGRRALVLARGQGEERGIGLGIGLALVAFITYSAVQSLFYLQAIQVLFWAMAALACVGANEVPAPRARLACGLAAAAALAVQVVASPAALTRVRAEAATQPRGFHRLERWSDEGPFRWSVRRGTLCLYPSGPSMTMRFASLHPRRAAQPVTVSLEIGGRLVDRFEIGSDGATRRTVFLPEAVTPRPRPRVPFGECAPGHEAVRLTVETDRVFSPRTYGALDQRHLGVAVFEPSFATLTPPDVAGLYAPEGGLRWTGARAAFAVGIPSAPSRVILPIRATNPDIARRPLGVDVYWNGDLKESLRLDRPEWHLVTIQARSVGTAVLTLQPSRVWQPSETGPALDRRHLGVQVAPIRIESGGTPGG